MRVSLLGKSVSIPLTLLILLIAIILAQAQIREQLQVQEEFKIDILWVVKSNPSDYDDQVVGICKNNDRIYLVGSINSSSIQLGTFKGRVEAYSEKAELLGYIEFKGLPTTCTIFSSSLVVAVSNITMVGLTVDLKALLMISSLDLARVEFKDLEWVMGTPTSLITDKSYLYVTGSEVRLAELASIIRVDKLDSNFKKISTFTSQTPEMGVILLPADSELEPKKGYLWIVGGRLEMLTGRARWIIEVINTSDMSSVKSLTTDIEGVASSITFDGKDYVYIVGSLASAPAGELRGSAIAKLDIEGSIVKVIKIENVNLTDVVYAQGYLLVAGSEMTEDYERSTLYIFDENLNLIAKRYLDMGAYNSYAYKIVINGDIAFITGSDYEPGNLQYTLYAVRIQPPITPVTPTITTVTTTITTTITETITTTIDRILTTTTTTIQTITQTKTHTITTTQIITTTMIVERVITMYSTTTTTETIRETVREILITTTTITKLTTETLRVTEVTTIRETRITTSPLTITEVKIEREARMNTTIVAFIIGFTVALLVTRFLLRRV